MVADYLKSKETTFTRHTKNLQHKDSCDAVTMASLLGCVDTYRLIYYTFTSTQEKLSTSTEKGKVAQLQQMLQKHGLMYVKYPKIMLSRTSVLTYYNSQSIFLVSRLISRGVFIDLLDVADCGCVSSLQLGQTL